MRQLVDNALTRLEKKGHVKHHTQVDAFTLSHKYREELKGRIETLLIQEDALRMAARARVVDAVRELGIDYPVPHDLVAQDAVWLLEHIFSEQGRLAATALLGRGLFSSGIPSKKRVDSIGCA